MKASQGWNRRAALAWLGGGAWPAWAQSGDPPQPLLARPAPAEVDPRPYLVSEKLDGVRALWDGRVLRFRSGRTVAAPGWFLAQLPAEPLDGELWIGRQRFDALSSAVRRAEPQDEAWQQIGYHVFELPAGAGDFAMRAARLATLGNAVIVPIPQVRVETPAALRALLGQVLAQGGEGLMLHRADAPVLSGRSDALLKLKLQADAEAVVVAHEPGRGRLAGQLGALVVQTPEGLRFKLGSGLSDAQRRNPPPVGSTITYRYRELTPSGKPRFASFLRVADPF